MEISKGESINFDSVEEKENISIHNDENNQKDNSKAEGISNDLVNTLEPFIQVVEKLTNQDRSFFMGKLVMGAVKGKIGEAIGGAFGEQKKKTRLDKFKDVFEIAIWLLVLVMLVFWLNFGIAKWMGIV